MKGQEDRGGRSHQSLMSAQKKEGDFMFSGHSFPNSEKASFLCARVSAL